MNRLPIEEIRGALAGALQRGNRVLIEAPTGSGKSTRIPQFLVDDGLAERVTVLEPRRLATRMLAARVAMERGTEIGGEVGYSMRFDRRISDSTRIEFVTEGLLLRRLAGGARLPDALVFDEFHERNLDGDIALALALNAQATHSGMKVLILSATLDVGWLADRIAPCEVLQCGGRIFPVGIHWRKGPAPRGEDCCAAVAEGVREACSAVREGHVLAFLPGAYEIARTARLLEQVRPAGNPRILRLHGELPPAEQDAALRSGPERKVILSTNVAETSLTIHGVTAVVDSGLARVARFDPSRGINALLVEKVSHASAEQRAGRAGRTAPGQCFRMWTEEEHGRRALHTTPEVHRVDLSEVLLLLASMMGGFPDKFPWMEPPSAAALGQARSLLVSLGAIHAESGEITAMGKSMLLHPAHPRCARMLVEAGRLQCGMEAAAATALLQGRPVRARNPGAEVEEHRESVLGTSEKSDFHQQFRALEFAKSVRFDPARCERLGIHANAARDAWNWMDRLAGTEATAPLEASANFAQCLLAGFGDHLAVRLDSGTLRCALTRGRRGTLARDSAVREARLLVPVEIREVNTRGGVETLLSLATAVEPDWLSRFLDLSETTEVSLDPSTKRIVSRRHQCIGDLVVEHGKPVDAGLDEAARLLAREVLAGRAKLADWDENTRQWVNRLNSLCGWMPELGLPTLAEADLPGFIEQACHGARSLRDLAACRIRPVLQDWLNGQQREWLAKHAPVQWRLPNGRTGRITYETNGQPPSIDVFLRDLAGVPDSFRIAGGRVSLRIRILAPNGRPVQITDHLAGFWADAYPKIKAELQRKYPKHPMP